jgi:hypothetical protein
MGAVNLFGDHAKDSKITNMGLRKKVRLRYEQSHTVGSPYSGP